MTGKESGSGDLKRLHPVVGALLELLHNRRPEEIVWQVLFHREMMKFHHLLGGEVQEAGNVLLEKIYVRRRVDMDDFERELKRLDGLLKDPQPGVSVWIIYSAAILARLREMMDVALREVLSEEQSA